MSKVITIGMFAKATIDQIETIYIGKDNGCRCGCRGKYYDTCDHAFRNVVRLKRAKLLVLEQGAKYELGEGYVNIVTGEDRAMCIYFNR